MLVVLAAPNRPGHLQQLVDLSTGEPLESIHYSGNPTPQQFEYQVDMIRHHHATERLNVSLGLKELQRTKEDVCDLALRKNLPSFMRGKGDKEVRALDRPATATEIGLPRGRIWHRDPLSDRA
jgi:hypothetical protein